MKLISKIILIGAFFCGTLGQASSHKRLLTFDQFMSLNTPQKAAYLGTIRDAFINAEKAERRKGMKFAAQNPPPQLPNFTSAFFSEALADNSKLPCIYAGNLSYRSGPGLEDKCFGIYGGAAGCKGSTPTECNSLLFGKGICIAVPTGYDINKATEVCTDKTPYSLEDIAKQITKDRLGDWNAFSKKLNEYCDVAQVNPWRHAHQEDLCARLVKRTADMQRAIDSQIATVTAEGTHVDTAACQAPPAIARGCDFTIEGKTYHIDYGLNNGKFFTQLHVPENEEFSTDAVSNCKNGPTLPAACDLFISKNTNSIVQGSEVTVTQGYKISGADETGYDGKTMCNWEKYGDADTSPAGDSLCNADTLGPNSHTFCVAQSENKYKAVTYTEDGHGGAKQVRICESEFPNGPWKAAGNNSTSGLDRIINSTSRGDIKQHSRFPLDVGKKTLTGIFINGTVVSISRSKPKDQPMYRNIQVCEFTPLSLDGTPSKKPIVGKYFSEDGIYTSDNLPDHTNHTVH